MENNSISSLQYETMPVQWNIFLKVQMYRQKNSFLFHVAEFLKIEVKFIIVCKERLLYTLSEMPYSQGSSCKMRMEKNSKHMDPRWLFLRQCLWLKIFFLQQGKYQHWKINVIICINHVNLCILMPWICYYDINETQSIHNKYLCGGSNYCLQMLTVFNCWWASLHLQNKILSFQ